MAGAVIPRAGGLRQEAGRMLSDATRVRRGAARRTPLVRALMEGWKQKQQRKREEKASRDWEEVQQKGWVSEESAFDKKAIECLKLYQSFLQSPVGNVIRAVGGDREAALLTGLFGLFAVVFGTVVYIVLDS